MAGLTIIGLMPLGLGWLLNWYMTIHPETFPPMFIIGVAFLLVWGYISWRVNNKMLATGIVMLSQNCGAVAAVVLLAIQALQGGYWENTLGMVSQMFFMPMLYVGSVFFNWMGVFGVFFACFALMILASVIGCKIAER